MVLDQRTNIISHTQLVSSLDQRTLKGCLELFLLSCRVEELSPFTTKNYEQKLEVFIRFCSEAGCSDVKHITPHHIKAFLLKLQDTCQRVSIYNNCRAINRFFNWMVEEKVIKEKNNPMSSVHFRKPPDKLIRPFTLGHIRDLLLLCDDSKFLGARNKAIILTFWDTGLRLSELANIAIEDVDFDHEIIKVMGKGAKERVVRIGKKTQKALLRYLLMRNDGLPCLWVSEERRPLTHWGIEIMIRKLGKRARFSGVRCSPHTFRHTCATDSLRNGAGLEHVKSLLGHTTLYMTMRYAATISSEDAVKSHRRFGPVDNLLR